MILTVKEAERHLWIGMDPLKATELENGNFKSLDAPDWDKQNIIQKAKNCTVGRY